MFIGHITGVVVYRDEEFHVCLFKPTKGRQEDVRIVLETTPEFSARL
jgi:hypothetical protein